MFFLSVHSNEVPSGGWHFADARGTRTDSHALGWGEERREGERGREEVRERGEREERRAREDKNMRRYLSWNVA